MKRGVSPFAVSFPHIGISLDKVALALDVSPNTVLRMVEEGRLPRPRIWNRRKIWRVAEIDAALAEWPTDRPDMEQEDAPELDEWRAEV